MLDRGENLSLALDRNEPAALDFTLQVERLYAALIAAANSGPGLGTNSEPELGGKFLYAGELDRQCRALLVAGNIAGAASLAVTADSAAQKQAIRDGVADFLVTSLDEALRILKNQIRKRETVAVCVALAPQAPEADFACRMLERGVLPDLLPPGFSGTSRFSTFFGPGVRQIELVAPEDSQTLLTWHVAAAPAIWLPKLDAIALDCLSPDSSPAASAARRWLRLAPRYLGRLAQGVRLLRCGESFAANFLERVREQVERAEIGVPVEIRLSGRGECEEYWLSPPRGSESAG
jgi:hypothetical protein